VVVAVATAAGMISMPFTIARPTTDVKAIVIWPLLFAVARKVRLMAVFAAPAAA
jgi:hypothetical protein